MWRKRWWEKGEAYLNWHWMKTAQMCDVIKWEVFTWNNSKRAVCVLADQTAMKYSFEQALECPLYVAEWNEKCANHHIDMLAIAWYFNSWLWKSTNSWTILSWIDDEDINEYDKAFEQIFTWWLLDWEPITKIKDVFDDYKNLAKEYWMKLWVYEWWQHITALWDWKMMDNDKLTNFFQTINRDERMYDVYQKLFDYWKDDEWIRTVFNHYVDINKPSKYWSFGALDDLNVSREKNVSPRYASLVDWQKNNFCTWTWCKINFQNQTLWWNLDENNFYNFEENSQIKVSHPRILWDNDKFKKYFKPFEDLSCSNEKNSDWWKIFNIKNLFDNYTKWWNSCDSNSKKLPEKLEDVDFAKFYLKNEWNWSRNKALQAMFFLRNNWFGDFTDDEINNFKQKFIAYEFARFTSEDDENWYKSPVWENHWKCFDIWTEPTFKFYSIFVDTFWNDLTNEQHKTISEKFEERVDCYLENIKNNDWTIANWNNWNAILWKAAIYWAIVYYYENPKAKKVIKETLNHLKLHKDFYLSDWAYKEWIVEYTNVSFTNLREIINLLKQSLWIVPDFNWENIKKTSDWFLEWMAPDGMMVDFWDSWAKRWWTNLEPLNMMLIDEIVWNKSLWTENLDPCKVKKYFENKWYDQWFYDPWSLQPSLARNWTEIVNSCNQQWSWTTIKVFEKWWMWYLRTKLPWKTNLAKDNSSLRYSQADETFIWVSAVPNTFPHRERDFWAFIWSAFGSRLIYDFWYWDIGKRYSDKYKIIDSNWYPHIDDFAIWTNTLVASWAFLDWDENTDITQILW